MCINQDTSITEWRSRTIFQSGRFTYPHHWLNRKPDEPNPQPHILFLRLLITYLTFFERHNNIRINSVPASVKTHYILVKKIFPLLSVKQFSKFKESKRVGPKITFSPGPTIASSGVLFLLTLTNAQCTPEVDWSNFLTCRCLIIRIRTVVNVFVFVIRFETAIGDISCG
jgi:hypothetical protein